MKFGFSRNLDDPGPPASTALLVFQGIPSSLDSEEGRLHRKCGRAHLILKVSQGRELHGEGLLIVGGGASVEPCPGLGTPLSKNPARRGPAGPLLFRRLWHDDPPCSHSLPWRALLSAAQRAHFALTRPPAAATEPLS